MRKARICFILFICMILCVNFAFPAFAMNSEFDLSEADSATLRLFIRNSNMDSNKEKTEGKGILCFDVNENGLIAVGFSGYMPYHTIDIYDLDGSFKYGYKFNSDGTYSVQWDGDNLIIYFTREDIAASVNKNGEYVKIMAIDDTIKNNSLWNKIRSNRRTTEAGTYVIKNKPGLDSLSSVYSVLEFTDKNGSKKILYDAGNSRQIIAAITLAAFLIFGIIVITLVTRSIIKANNKYIEDKIARQKVLDYIEEHSRKQ